MIELHQTPYFTKTPKEYQKLFVRDILSTSGSAIYIYPVISSLSQNFIISSKYRINSPLSEQTEVYSYRLRTNILNQVDLNIKNLPNGNVRWASENIVKLFGKYLRPYQNIDLPRIYSFIRDEGSFLIEWNFTHYKVGISVETVIEESSWHFVSDETFGYFAASGNTQNENFDKILEWLIPFIVKNHEA